MAPIATSLTIVAPPQVTKGVAFTISGKLTRTDAGAGVPNAPLWIYYDTITLGNTTTDSSGGYSVIAYITELGTFQLKCVFEGSAEFAAILQAVNIKVIGTGPLPSWVVPTIIGLAIGIPAIIILYHYAFRKR